MRWVPLRPENDRQTGSPGPGADDGDLAHPASIGSGFRPGEKPPNVVVMLGDNEERRR